jgi:putative ABC transport system ATP-binding protein
MPAAETTTQRTTPAARLHAVSHSFGRPPHRIDVLRNLDLDVGAGELTLITGPSGSGKTTLLSVLGLLLRPVRGAVELCGCKLEEWSEKKLPALRRQYVSFIFQSFNLLSALTARENVQVALGLQGVRGRDAELGAKDLLARVGLSDRGRHRPSQLSCGQQQRVAIARALASPAPLLLADEPTGNLDTENALEVVALLKGVTEKENRAVVVVTHDPRLEEFADRTIGLEDGRIVMDRKEATR